ncbi:nuclear transport factor 2 family protein [Geodermatophilus sp. URMC 65]
MTSTTVEDLMLRNVLGVFGERGAAARAAAIAELYAPDVVLHLGAEAVHGTQALDEHVRTLLDSTPGFVFQTLGEAEVDGRLGTRAWGFGPEGASPVVTGRDVVRVEDGRITEILVFVHPSAAD